MTIKTFTKTQAETLVAALVAASLPVTGVALSNIASRKYAAIKSQHVSGGRNLTVEYSAAPTPEQIEQADVILKAFNWSA